MPFIDRARDESRRMKGRRNGRGCNQLEARPQPPYDLQCREKPRTKDVRDCCTLTFIHRKHDVTTEQEILCREVQDYPGGLIINRTIEFNKRLNI